MNHLRHRAAALVRGWGVDPRDALALLVVSLCCLVLSVLYLFGTVGMGGRGTGSDPRNFVASISVAYGDGFKRPLPCPEVDAFVAQSISELPEGWRPTAGPDIWISQWDLAHRYLVVYIGWVWRLFGVSWYTFKLALIPPFLLAGLLVYLLLRLGAGPWLALAGTVFLMTAPVMSEMHLGARDFIKLPFAYAVVLAAAYLIRYPVSRRSLFLTAAAGGLALGLGYGFRQDLIMFLPVLAAGVVFGPHGPEIRVLHRLAAAALALTTAITAAFPIVSQVVREEGSQGYHDLLMGWSHLSMDQLQLEPASYELFYEHHDDFPYALRQHEARYRSHMVIPLETEIWRDSEEARSLLLQTVWWFPADWATRGLAALRAGLTSTELRTGPARSDIPRPGYLRVFESIHDAAGLLLRWLVPLLAAAGLILVALRDLPRAWLLFLLLLYVTGYTSLQFALRHAFQLSILPVWITTAWMGWALCRWQTRGHGHGVETAAPLSLGRYGRVAFNALGAILLIAIPYGVLQNIQAANMSYLAREYRNAPLGARTPVQQESDGWVDFQMIDWQHCSESTDDLDAAWFLLSTPPENRELVRGLAAASLRSTGCATELALFFEGGEGPVHLALEYGLNPEFDSFERELTVMPPDGSDSFMYYVPAWETNLSFGRGRMEFAGFRLRPEDAPRLAGVYQVADGWRLPLPLNLALGQDPDAFRPYYRLGKWTAD
ncbi:MAG: hypothetical protein GC168_15860 [Candidatus Hydrogenedens sp.]|nr:hypothetical protein [Candidatus Hydrogenedens sp.]